MKTYEISNNVIEFLTAMNFDSEDINEVLSGFKDSLMTYLFTTSELSYKNDKFTISSDAQSLAESKVKTPIVKSLQEIINEKTSIPHKVMSIQAAIRRVKDGSKSDKDLVIYNKLHKNRLLIFTIPLILLLIYIHLLVNVFWVYLNYYIQHV